MALSKDQKTSRFGVETHDPISLPLKASATVYRGSIALTDSSGRVKNAASPAATDKCWGLIKGVSPGCGQIDSAPGITGGSNDGDVRVEVEQGAFFLGSSTGADQLGTTTIGQTVYVYDENTVAATNGSNTRPAAGIHVGTNTAYPGGYAIKMGSNQTAGGGL